jgi:putative FmdB family regulatory protein
MPTYEYACQKCDHTFEQFQSMRDEPLTRCPSCGKKALKRLVGGGAGLIFKGSGFYITDYKNKGGGPSKTAGEGKAGDSGAKSAPATTTSAPAAAPAAAPKPAASSAKT